MKVEHHLDRLLSEQFRATRPPRDRSRPAAKFLVVLVMIRSWFHKQKQAQPTGGLNPPTTSETLRPRTRARASEENAAAPPRSPSKQQQQQQQQADYPTTASTRLNLLPGNRNQRLGWRPLRLLPPPQTSASSRSTHAATTGKPWSAAGHRSCTTPPPPAAPGSGTTADNAGGAGAVRVGALHARRPCDGGGGGGAPDMSLPWLNSAFAGAGWITTMPILGRPPAPWI